MKVVSFVKSLDGCSFHRVFLPNKHIKADVRTVHNITEDDLKWCDILHYSRHCLYSPQFFEKYREKYGFKIIVDTDDWWEVGKDHPKYELWSKGNTSLQIRSHLMMADAVTTTHERLAEIIPNHNIFILPNCLPYGEGQFKFKQKKSKKVRLLYASTIVNWRNTDLIAGAMKKLSHLPVEVVIAGYHKEAHPLFEKLVDNLTGSGVLPYRFTDWRATEEYMSGYEGDILLVPSKNTQFNSFKSNLKVLEAAAMGIPAVVSQFDPYLGLPVNYALGEAEWLKEIEALMDPDHRKACAKRLQEFCHEHYDMNKWSEKRLEVYESIL